MYKERLDISHQPLLEEKFRSLNIPLSEYSFANAYLFRDIHRYEVVFGKESALQGYTRDGFIYAMPLFKPSEKSFPFLKEMMEEVHFLFPIPLQWIDLFPSSHYQASYKEEDSDYLFQKAKLASYPGNHLNAKRNLVKQLLLNDSVEAYPLLQTNQADALAILESWQHGQSLEKTQTDYFACQEAIEKREGLGLSGRLIYVNRQPAGLSLGEYLTDDCYVIHFSKALKNYKGIYQYLYQDLAKSLPETVCWINMEQDLGSATIRQAKRSYQPDRMAHKMRVKIY